MEVPAIVITDARRSGTHLLYRLLDGHPRLFNSLTEVYLLEYAYLLSPAARQRFVDFYFGTGVHELFDAIYERELLPLFRGRIRLHGSLQELRGGIRRRRR